MPTDEVYFACKKAMQDSASPEEAIAKLREIFTSEIQAEMKQKNREYQTETFKTLNRERMKAYRDRTRKNKYASRKKNP